MSEVQKPFLSIPTPLEAPLITTKMVYDEIKLGQGALRDPGNQDSLLRWIYQNYQPTKPRFKKAVDGMIAYAINFRNDYALNVLAAIFNSAESFGDINNFFRYDRGTNEALRLLKEGPREGAVEVVNELLKPYHATH